MSNSLMLGVLSGMAIFLAVFLVLQCCFVRDRDGKSGVRRFRWKGSSFKKKSESETSQLVRRESETNSLPDRKSSGIVDIPIGPWGSSRRPSLPNTEVVVAGSYGSVHHNWLASRPAPPSPTSLLAQKEADCRALPVSHGPLGFREENNYVTPQHSPLNNSPFSTPPESVADETEQEGNDPIGFM